MAKDSSTGTILLLGGLGVAVWGYFQGWFSSLGFAPAAAATTPGTTTTTTTTSTAANPPAATAAAPKLGTVLTSAAQLAAQVAAGDAYILPGPTLISQPPTGYSLASDSNNAEVGYPATNTAPGTFYVRNDVAAALVGVLNAAQVATHTGPGNVTTATLYQFPIQSLTQLQQIMTAAGLSGLGGLAQYMYTRTGRVRYGKWN